MPKSKLEAECGDIAVALVQNKVDLVDQAAVSPTEVESLARKLGVKLYRACVKEGINVTEVREYPRFVCLLSKSTLKCKTRLDDYT